MAVLKKSSPWITYYREVNELFRRDKDVLVVYDEENTELKIYVNDQTKADAIRFLIPIKKEFGNVTLKIDVIPSNGKQLRGIDTSNVLSIACNAFTNNDAVYMVTDVGAVFNLVYVIFRKEVVQYFDDNIGDAYGNCSTLYETIARDVFNDIGIKFCTDCGKENRSVWDF